METIQITPRKITIPFKKNFYEHQAWAQDQYIVGIDEVGRGCTAGCVVASAVILHPNRTHRLLKDSKTLSQDELKIAYRWIVKNSWWAVGNVHQMHIDEKNIYRASQMAMLRALAQLQPLIPRNPSHILTDAMPLNQNVFPAELHYFIKGESKSISIAAASIVAKVSRDRIMGALHASFPLYGLAQHKGYNTALHQQAIKRHGITLLHRTTFIHESHDHEQQTLFC